jgi:hypothetical protein
LLSSIRSFLAHHRLAAAGAILVGLVLVVGAVRMFASNPSRAATTNRPTVLVDRAAARATGIDSVEFGAQLRVTKRGCVGILAKPGVEVAVVWPSDTKVSGKGQNLRIRTGGVDFKIGDNISFGAVYAPGPGSRRCGADPFYVDKPHHE